MPARILYDSHKNRSNPIAPNSQGSPLIKATQGERRRIVHSTRGVVFAFSYSFQSVTRPRLLVLRPNARLFPEGFSRDKGDWVSSRNSRAGCALVAYIDAWRGTNTLFYNASLR